MDARTYVRSDPALSPYGPEQLGAAAIRFLGDVSRVTSLDLPGRTFRQLAARTGSARPAVDPSDPPWCPEGGAAWTIHSDPSSLAGGTLALWIQALHPLALAGVMEHSKFAEDPMGRLQRTSGFVAATTFAPGSVAQAAVDRVNRVHDHINGIAPDGRPYDAHDGELIDWVHCALLLAMARCWLRYGHHPDPDRLDDYVAEQRRVAMELGDTDPPRDWSELLDHIEAHRPNLVVNEQTRFMDRWLWTPTLSGSWRLLLPGHRLMHSAALAAAPDWVHDLYGNRRFLPGRFAGQALAVGMSSLLTA